VGRKQYFHKQQELIYGDVSLVEIDLLRKGDMGRRDLRRCVDSSVAKSEIKIKQLVRVPKSTHYWLKLATYCGILAAQ